MMQNIESNLRCPKCGEPLMATEGMAHRYYTCQNSHCKAYNDILAVKGTDHYFHCDEIDIKTGEVTGYEEPSNDQKESSEAKQP